MTTEVRASHILVKTEEEAKKLLDEIKNGESFAEAAQKYSLCPSGRDKSGFDGFAGIYDRAKN